MDIHLYIKKHYIYGVHTHTFLTLVAVYPAIITLNTNGLNVPIKRGYQSGSRKQDPTVCCKKPTLTIKAQVKSKMDGGKNANSFSMCLVAVGK